MGKSTRHELTQILMASRGEGADPAEVASRVFEAVHSELRQLASGMMHHERPDHTLEPTALVNETYLRLVDGARVDWQNRAHFFGVAARAMRQVLVEHARRRATAKRGGGWQRITLNEDVGFHGDSQVEVLDLERALTRLGEMDPRMVQIVELRVFAGMNVEEVAHVLGVSARTVHGDWRVAKMWLARELAGRKPHEG